MKIGCQENVSTEWSMGKEPRFLVTATVVAYILHLIMLAIA